MTIFLLNTSTFFNSNLSLQTTYNQIRNKQHFLYGDIGTTGYAPKLNAASYEWGREKANFIGHALDIFLDGRFKLFKQEQQFIVGISGDHRTSRGGFYLGETPTGDLLIANTKPDALLLTVRIMKPLHICQKQCLWITGITVIFR